MNKKSTEFIRIAIIAAILVFVGVYWYFQPNDPFKVLAILGSLSWLLLLYNLIERAIVKPDVEIIPDKMLEIGYTTLGPIINMHIALFAKNKRSLIRNMEMNVTHENNDTYKLSWEWFEELIHEMNLPETNVPTRKNQKAIALNIGEDELIEKKIGFQHKQFKRKYSQSVLETSNKYLNIVINGQGNAEEVRRTDEYNKMRDLFSNSFIWKSGRYTSQIKVYIIDRDLPFLETIEFELTPLDITSLSSNISICQNIVEHSFTGVQHESFGNWNWISKERK